MVLYFSASGNSRFIAEYTAECLQDTLADLGSRIKEADFSPLDSERPFVFVCPTFAWRIPRIVEDHLQKTELSGNDKIYLLITACGSSGNAGYYGEKFFQSRRMQWMGWHTFYMPGSYVAFMENPDIAHGREMNQRARKELDEIIPLIRRGEALPRFPVTGAGRFMSRAANPFFYRFIIGKPGFHTDSRCVGCGKCAAVCPLNNIAMEDGRPKWGGSCTHCMACVHRCPHQAVEFRKITVGKNRWYNTGE